MKGQKQIIKALNEALSIELTAINQYFVHARMFQDWGFDRLGAKMYKESMDEMRHADELIQRVLFLEGIPAISKYRTIKVGRTVPTMFQNDLRLELSGVEEYRAGIQLCVDSGDSVSRDLMERILIDSEEHVDWIETQLSLIERVGLEGYLAEQIQGDKPA